MVSQAEIMARLEAVEANQQEVRAKQAEAKEANRVNRATVNQANLAVAPATLVAVRLIATIEEKIPGVKQAKKEAKEKMATASLDETSLEKVSPVETEVTKAAVILAVRLVKLKLAKTLDQILEVSPAVMKAVAMSTLTDNLAEVNPEEALVTQLLRWEEVNPKEMKVDLEAMETEVKVKRVAVNNLVEVSQVNKIFVYTNKRSAVPKIKSKASFLTRPIIFLSNRRSIYVSYKHALQLKSTCACT